jgi:putative zinc finger/helix-turn-helix YgiT family protein
MTEQSNIAYKSNDTSVRCGQCGSGHVAKATQDDVFTYGTGRNAVELSVPVPVYSCQQCGFTFTTDVAETLRHDAICKHFGLLTPAQIRNIRSRVNLTRERFAALTGIGTASLSRWETGELIQSAGYDKYLRLLESAENLQQLKKWAADQSPERDNFRTEVRRVAGPFRALEAAGRLEISRGASSTFSLCVAASELVH